MKAVCWNWADGKLATKLMRTPEKQSAAVKGAHLPDCGPKMVVFSFSMASKKSVKAFAVSTLGVSFEPELSVAVSTGVDGANAGSNV